MQRRRRGRVENEQTNLFYPKRVSPACRAFPVETREQVTKLVAQMLSAHRARHAAVATIDGADEEVRYD